MRFLSLLIDIAVEDTIDNHLELVGIKYDDNTTFYPYVRDNDCLSDAMIKTYKRDETKMVIMPATIINPRSDEIIYSILELQTLGIGNKAKLQMRKYNSFNETFKTLNNLFVRNVEITISDGITILAYNNINRNSVIVLEKEFYNLSLEDRLLLREMINSEGKKTYVLYDRYISEACEYGLRLGCKTWYWSTYK